MDPRYAARYVDLFRRHWWWRAREVVILRELASRLPPGAAGRVLDVGCGGGALFGPLARYGAVEGIEPDAALAAMADTTHGRVHAVPFDERFRPAAPFGLVVMLDVLEHLDDPAGALRHAASLLRPGGLLVATVPAFNALWTTHDVLNAHRTRYTRTTLRQVAAGSGLRLLHDRYLFHWMVPAKLLVRAFEAVRRPAPALPTVPPGPLNRALFLLSRADERLLGPLRLPFGSSVLAVFERPADAPATMLPA